jgi:hypothetical protein
VIVRAKHGHALIGEWLTLLTDLVHLCTEAAGWLLRYVGTVTGLGHPRHSDAVLSAALCRHCCWVIGSGWESKPPAVAGKLRPLRLNHRGWLVCWLRQDAGLDLSVISFGRYPKLVSGPCPSWNRSILTEIYLCHTCSYHEIDDGNGAGAGQLGACARAAFLVRASLRRGWL